MTLMISRAPFSLTVNSHHSFFFLRSGLQALWVSIGDKAQNDVVLDRRLKRADQECEAAGGIGDIPDELVAGAGETGFGNLNVGGVVRQAKETELDRRRGRE
jgi:hypothetical protein